MADGYPLLLTTVSSLDALNSLIAQGDHAAEGPLPMNRFRPNVVVAGTRPWRGRLDADRRRRGRLPGRQGVRALRRDHNGPDHAERGKEPLRTLARHRRVGGKLAFGQNLVPQSPGVIRLGDPVTILD